MTAAATSEEDRKFILEVLPCFVSEAHEQIEMLEQLLLQLEEQPAERSLLDALFRCAHTVKGSAGIFGLDELVGFTHHVETLLDQMREGHIAFSPRLGTLFLECNDQMLHLVERAGQEGADLPERIGQRANLVAQLQAAMAPNPASPAHPATTAAPANGPGAAAAEAGVPAGAAARWWVSVRFGADCFRNGMDPLGIIRYLGTLGTVTPIVSDRLALPALEALDPESCHLGFEFGLETEATRTAIEDAFSFVKDDCELHLVEPAAPVEHFSRLLDAMPDRPALGDILVRIGAITQQQLDAGLQVQAVARQEIARQDSGTAVAAPRIGDVLQRQTGVAPQVIEAALGKQQKLRAASPPADESRYIRVQADRLDAVINLLGELVVASAGATMMARESRQGVLMEANLHVNRLIEEIRNGTLGLRMVPVGETFNRFRRVVRDTAAALNKEVDFEIMGGDAELDKSMVEKIADPLMHLVRNSLDHGLEPAAERLAAGKPATGKLSLSARHETGCILIRIEDDGRGINRQRVLERAWSRGLVEQGVVPGDDAIHMLIFEPGFSTAEQVTNLSGRGVGMDVVRQNIEALRGSIQLINAPGQGLRIDIRLPLTLAIIDGFLVGVGKSKFVLPLGSVIEVIEAGGHGARADEAGRHCIALRGSLLPVVRLRSMYAIPSARPERVSVVVVSAQSGQYGIEVESLLGQHQTVIKPMGRLFKSVRGISGSSILGNGEVALILDVNSLADLVMRDTTDAVAAPGAEQKAAVP